ncbi:hypothetical protein [Clostridium beijerinckii]|jgi:hypothetical protein|nr:hypothetical protein [Clostridium beijerinckii]
MGSFKRNIGIKLMGGLRSVDNTVLVSKKLDEKLKELSSINEQVKKGTIDQSEAVRSVNSLTSEMSKSINGVVINAEQLTNAAQKS